MQLRHYSSVEIDKVVVQPNKSSYVRNDKPHGFWVSVPGKDDWPSWCESEDFRLDYLCHEHIVTLTEDARILYLTCDENIEHFTIKYGVQDPTSQYMGYREIRWNELYGKYQGIIIAPYSWHHRLEGIATNWYYGWDCASGCIWDISAIASINSVASMLGVEGQLCQK